MRRKQILRILGRVALVVAITGLSATAFVARDRWVPWLSSEAETADAEQQQVPVEDAKVLKLSPQARKNLRLASKSVILEYWMSAYRKRQMWWNSVPSSQIVQFFCCIRIQKL